MCQSDRRQIIHISTPARAVGIPIPGDIDSRTTGRMIQSPVITRADMVQTRGRYRTQGSSAGPVILRQENIHSSGRRRNPDRDIAAAVRGEFHRDALLDLVRALEELSGGIEDTLALGFRNASGVYETGPIVSLSST